MEIGKFIKQYKGKDFSKVPKSKLLKDNWYVGRKFDGNYTQIHKKGDTVIMFTSGGVPFCVEEICTELIKLDFDFIIEAEFMNNCDGKTLNDRTKCSTGTARANFQKKLPTSYPNSSIRVFDILNFDGIDLRQIRRKSRQERLVNFNLNEVVAGVRFIKVDLEEAQEIMMNIVKNNGEGTFIFHETHTIEEKGRSNLAIKLKADNQKRMVCIGAESSDTVAGEWGTLVLRDENGIEQSFGGLTNDLRRMFPDIPIGEKFNVKYENFSDSKYIQGFLNV